MYLALHIIGSQYVNIYLRINSVVSRHIKRNGRYQSDPFDMIQVGLTALSYYCVYLTSWHWGIVPCKSTLISLVISDVSREVGLIRSSQGQLIAATGCSYTHSIVAFSTT